MPAATGTGGIGGRGGTRTPLTGPNPAIQAALRDQLWLVTLTGMVGTEFTGTLANDWNRETLALRPGIAAALERVVAAHGIARPPNSIPVFEVEQAAPFASVSAALGPAPPPPSPLGARGTQAGFAADAWRVDLTSETELPTKVVLNRIFVGLSVDLAVRNRGASIHRVSYIVSMLGRIRFAAPRPTIQ